jgi:hypothetical protein
VGRATREDDKVRIRANAVVPLEQADEELEMQASGVLIRVPAGLCEDDWLLDLEALLRRHRGALPVYLDVAEESGRLTRVQLGAGCQVRGGRAFLAEAESSLGKGRVKSLFRSPGGNGRERNP